MASAEELYQEIILEHNRQPRNFGKLDDASHAAHGKNPLCGDETMIQLRITDGRIVDARFSGQGCAISLASASMLTEAVTGMTHDNARSLASRMLMALRDDSVQLDLSSDGELASLSGVRKFPARIRCAVLPWQALIAALDGEQTASSEEGVR